MDEIITAKAREKKEKLREKRIEKKNNKSIVA